MTAGMTAGAVANVRMQRGSLDLDVRVEVGAGEVVAVVGPNGAGKTTLVRAIAGFEAIERGVIEIGRRVVDDAAAIFVEPHDRNIGAVFQDSLLFPHLSVRDNVAFAYARGDRKSAHTEADAWLERVGLGGFGPRRPHELSGGQARRVAIARALIRRPDLVILDEPFAAIDAGGRAALQRLMAELIADESHRPGWLVVSHDPAQVDALANEVVVLEHGTVVQRGATADLRRFPATTFVAEFVGQNLLHGTASEGVVRLDQGLELAIADRSLAGEVAVTIPPSAVALHRDQPAGSPRNSWSATVGAVHTVGAYRRVALDGPVPLVVDVTPGAIDELAIDAGRSLWVAIKATSVECRPVG